MSIRWTYLWNCNYYLCKYLTHSLGVGFWSSESKRGKKLSDTCGSTNHGKYYEHLIYKKSNYIKFKMLCHNRLEKGLCGNGSDTVVSTCCRLFRSSAVALLGRDMVFILLLLIVLYRAILHEPLGVHLPYPPLFKQSIQGLAKGTPSSTYATSPPINCPFSNLIAAISIPT